MSKRIAVTGPESTGKSTLSAQLAAHFRTVWVPEYARAYLDQLPHPYGADDILAIAQGQVELEKQLAGQANRLLISDTELLVTKIWSEHAFGHCPEWILEALAHQRYDLYLLTGIDIPWAPDPQREHPHLRDYFYQRYRRELESRHWPFVEIWGEPSIRLDKAIRAVERVLG
ncbi:MAG: ATP-binding protein [Ferruginibacter sp.]|nr:ATP-binding protein [Cytophagales bacterium]